MNARRRTGAVKHSFDRRSADEWPERRDTHLMTMLELKRLSLI